MAVDLETTAAMMVKDATLMPMATVPRNHPAGHLRPGLPVMMTTPMTQTTMISVIVVASIADEDVHWSAGTAIVTGGVVKSSLR